MEGPGAEGAGGRVEDGNQAEHPGDARACRGAHDASARPQDDGGRLVCTYGADGKSVKFCVAFHCIGRSVLGGSWRMNSKSSEHLQGLFSLTL